LYSVLKVNVAALTGARVDVVGLPNMLNGRDKQTLTPTVWTEPASSKELDYEWTFDWESDNTSSATVDSDGLVTAGTTDGQANISCKVTILGNDYFGGYRVNVVTNPPGTLPGVFTFDEYGHYCFFAKTNLVYWKAAADDGYYEGYDRFDPLGSMRRGLFALGKNQYDYYTGRIYNGNINYRPVTNQATPGFDKFHFLVPQTLFSSSASTERIYALDYITEPDPKNWYNMGLHKIEYPIVEDLGTGWYAPSIGQWNYILFSRRASTIGTSRHCRFVRTVITGLAKEKTNDAYVRGLLILPDIYVHPDGLAAFQRINERNTEVSSSSWSVYNNAFTQFTADQLAQLEAAGCVFLASGGWYHGEYENSSNEMTARTDCTVSINSGGWYFDNMLYKDSLNESLRVYTYSGGTLGYYYGTWTSSSTACWDWRFSIRLIRDDGTFIHDYTRDDPVNW
ncbi:MAG: Ig-like domain-containing protein, partial [Bacteroidales bacterium]|nr:Ig-like domain-containing protein [Bacteroidales bacterium]